MYFCGEIIIPVRRNTETPEHTGNYQNTLKKYFVFAINKQYFFFLGGGVENMWFYVLF